MSTLAQRRNARALVVTLASIAAFVAFWAYAGAIGLAGGGADLGAEVTARLPFASPLFAALMLTLVVAVPMTVSAVAFLRSCPMAALIGGGSGALLVAWVTVQPFVIGTFFWLQPVCGLLGATMCVLAHRMWRRSQRSLTHAAPARR